MSSIILEFISGVSSTPLEGVTVAITGDNTSLTGTSDEDGLCTFETDDTTVAYSATCDNYSSSTGSITVTDGETTTITMKTASTSEDKSVSTSIKETVNAEIETVKSYLDDLGDAAITTLEDTVQESIVSAGAKLYYYLQKTISNSIDYYVQTRHDECLPIKFSTVLNYTKYTIMIAGLTTLKTTTSNYITKIENVLTDELQEVLDKLKETIDAE